MPSVRSYFFPWSLFLLSFILRLSFLSKGPYHLDCLGITITAVQNIQEGKFNLYHGLGYPLYSLLTTIFVFLGQRLSLPEPVLAVNFMNVFFGALCVFPFYFLSSKLFNPGTAFFATGLLTFSPINLVTSTYGNSHIASLFFLLVSASFLLKYLEDSSHFSLLLSGLSLGCSASIRLQDTVLIVLPLGLLLWSQSSQVSPGKNLSKAKAFVLWTASAGGVIIFFYTLFLWQSQTVAHSSFQFLRSNISYLFSGFTPKGIHITSLCLIANFSLGGLLVAAVGAGLIRKQDRKKFFFLMSWAIVPFLFACSLILVTHRYLSTMIIPVLIMQGYALARFFWSTSKGFRFAAIAAFTLLCTSSFWRCYPALVLRHHNAVSPDYGAWIGLHTEPNAVIITGDDYLFIQHYGRREILPHIVTDHDSCLRYPNRKQELLAYKNHLEDLMNRGIPVYATFLGLHADNKEEYFYKFIREFYNLDFVGTAYLDLWHRGDLKPSILENDLVKLTRKSFPAPSGH